MFKILGNKKIKKPKKKSSPHLYPTAYPFSDLFTLFALITI